MYNVDDAVAKIDGYIISVAGGGPFVGESKLVRIDEVGRTAAYASLVTATACPSGRREDDDEPAAAAPEAEPTGGRGGRGGRRQATIERLREQTPPWPQRRSAAFARQAEQRVPSSSR